MSSATERSVHADRIVLHGGRTCLPGTRLAGGQPSPAATLQAALRSALESAVHEAEKFRCEADRRRGAFRRALVRPEERTRAPASRSGDDKERRREAEVPRLRAGSADLRARQRTAIRGRWLAPGTAPWDAWPDAAA